MAAHAFVMFFTICSVHPRALCEDGFMLARSCQAAEQFIRRGLRPGQVLHLSGCEARP
jgi:hypothetical protein